MSILRCPRFPIRVALGLAVFTGCMTISTSYSGPSAFEQTTYHANLASAAGGPPTRTAAARFLQSATWGPTSQSIADVQSMGFERFLDEQFTYTSTNYQSLPLVPATPPADCPAGSTCRRDNYTMYPLQIQFFIDALYENSQLRQRVAFALHQIIVVSGAQITHPSRMAPYLQILDNNAFGNFRQLLYEITLNPAMGSYLNMVNNNKTAPNENYAREILQLFTIGLVRLNPDGTPQTDAQGRTIPTYDQDVVNAFSRVFTGWVFAPPPAQGIVNYIDPMVPNESRHDTGPKQLLRGVTLPPNQTAAKDLQDALDNIFLDPNVGPFISKQLIQHLVTSNPSPAYVARVTAIFNDNGSGVRGDLKNVVRAILLDPEALEDGSVNPAAGHFKHPALFISGLLRAFNAVSADGNDSSDGYLNPQSVNLGMDIFNPPSVFSYFSPFGGVSGSTLRGPEFGLLNTSTALRRANFVNTMVFGKIAVSANAPMGTSLYLSSYEDLANDPAAMVQELNILMMAGGMSPEMRDAIIAAVTAVPASNPSKRVRTAVYLIGSSAQYQVGR